MEASHWRREKEVKNQGEVEIWEEIDYVYKLRRIIGGKIC